MSDTAARPVSDRIGPVYPITLIVTALLGIWAAFSLTMDKIRVLENSHVVLDCAINPFITCERNLQSWQGSMFGFPNPIIGLLAWPAPIVVAMSIFAGARMANWYWRIFTIVYACAFLWCMFLLTQSFYALGTICVYCVLTWFVTSIGFVSTAGLTLSRGVWGDGARGAGRFILRWSPLIVVLEWLIIALLAQLRFNLIGLL